MISVALSLSVDELHNFLSYYLRKSVLDLEKFCWSSDNILEALDSCVLFFYWLLRLNSMKHSVWFKFAHLQSNNDCLYV